MEYQSRRTAAQRNQNESVVLCDQLVTAIYWDLLEADGHRQTFGLLCESNCSNRVKQIAGRWDINPEGGERESKRFGIFTRKGIGIQVWHSWWKKKQNQLKVD